jgi:hypothetical protein
LPRPTGDVGVNEDNGDPSRQDAVTAAASAPAATEDISALRQLVNSQQCVINKLLSRMNFVLSFISPVFKKGNPANANNYRPIALTSVMCKLMEVLIKDQIVQFLINKGLLSKSQHAFIKNHSTATNLLESPLVLILT